jgi:hypothetical protein
MLSDEPIVVTGNNGGVMNIEVTWTLTINAIIILLAISMMAYVWRNRVYLKSPSYGSGNQELIVATMPFGVASAVASFYLFIELYLPYGAFPLRVYSTFIFLSTFALCLGMWIAYKFIHLKGKYLQERVAVMHSKGEL